MFKSVRIQNFRQFKDLKLDGLAQINLITGKNNTGKTSLLEALFLQATPTDPEKVLTIAHLRGIENISTGGGYAWGFIFRDGRSDEPVVLDSRRADGIREQLKIHLSGDLETPIGSQSSSNGVRNEPVLSTTASTIAALEYAYEIESGSDVVTAVSSIRVNEDVRLTQRAKGLSQLPVYFLAHGPANAEADAARFSRLVEVRRKHEVVDVLRALDPRLVDLEVLALRPSTVTADLGSGPLVPIGYMGRGLERLLTIVLAILSTPGGTVLIDEIEEGLHYSVMPGVWKTLAKAALDYGVQIFATTHSLEAINAAVEGSAGHEGSLAFYRLDRRGDDIRVVTGEDDRLRAAVRVGAEIR
jgi:hypothetical protein